MHASQRVALLSQAEKLRRNLAGDAATDNAHVPLIDELHALVVTGDYKSAHTKLRSAKIAPEVKTAIIGAFNEHWLSELKIEWTNHGILRSFRFWPPETKARYLQETKALLEALKDISPHVCLGFGSVLALVRDRDFIPHDDDMDTLIAFDCTTIKSLKEGRTLVAEQLSKAGYSATGDYFSHWNVRKGQTAAIDVFVGLIEADRVSWFPSARKSLLASDVFPPIKAKLLGIELDIPRNPFAYLESTYGLDWDRPIPNWNHPWNKSEYADIA